MSIQRPLPEVHLSSLAYTFDHWLLRQGREDFIDLNAPYQRGSVWTPDQRRALIKSLYMGLPIGVIIVSALPFRSGNPYHYRIVDGKQRIEAVRAFVADEFDIPAWWLREEDRDPSNAKAYVYWSEMTERCQRRFEIHCSVPALEFKSEHEWLGRDANGKAIWRRRSDVEILVAEAELYGLVNGGGTAQTEADMERARLIAARKTGA